MILKCKATFENENGDKAVAVFNLDTETNNLSVEAAYDPDVYATQKLPDDYLYVELLTKFMETLFGQPTANQADASAT